MISLLIVNEFSSLQILSAAIKTTGKLSHLRDPETGSHLDRMSRYSRIIANAHADKRGIRDVDPKGELVYPDILFSKSRRNDMNFHLDRLCRETALKTAAV